MYLSKIADSQSDKKLFVDEMMAGHSRYRLSFTVGGLFIQQATIGVSLFNQCRDWRVVRSMIDEENLLQARTVSSARRLSRELVQRLMELTEEEIILLAESTSEERGHLLWVAACRRYRLIGEFAQEVVRERFVLLTPTLLPEHFEAFVRDKSLWHDELQELTESTRLKLGATTYLMLKEARLLSESGEILACVPSPRVAATLVQRIPSDLRFFPTNLGITGRNI